MQIVQIGACHSIFFAVHSSPAQTAREPHPHESLQAVVKRTLEGIHVLLRLEVFAWPIKPPKDIFHSAFQVTYICLLFSERLRRSQRQIAIKNRFLSR